MRKLAPLILIITIILCVCLGLAVFLIPSQAAQIYGPPSARLSIPQRVQYSALLLWYDGLLRRPFDETGGLVKSIKESCGDVTSATLLIMGLYFLDRELNLRRQISSFNRAIK